MRKLLLAGAFAALWPLGGHAQTAQELQNGANDTANVLNYGMGYNLQRFSPLTQINRQTVKRSRSGLELQLRRQQGEELQPLIYKGVLYVTTNSATMALDVKTGAADLEDQGRVSARKCRASSAAASSIAALALYDGKIFRTTLDANVIALDQKTGKELWRSHVIDFKDGYSQTVAPLVADGVVITGISGAEYGIRGFIDGWDPDDRQASVADLHHRRPGRSERQELARRHLAARRRFDLDHRLVRSRPAHRLLGHRQRRIVEPDAASGRQPLHLLGPGARSEDRADQVAFPVLAERSV